MSLELGHSNFNHVFNNVFIKGTYTYKLAYNDIGTNFWNNTSHGNYWSDWCSPDNDSDGIVDFPRNIDGGARDNYPIAWTPPPSVIESLSPTLIVILFVILPIAVFYRKRHP